MSYADTIKNLRKKNFSSIYLLYGTESYFMQDIKRKLEAHFREDDDSNISIYDLDETAIQEVIADAEEYPFFSDHKLIFAHNPAFLKAKPDKQTAEHDLKVLEEYLQHAAEWTTLVFLAPYEKIDERKKITKLMKKNGEAVSCEPVKEWDLGKWIHSLSAEYSIQLDEAAADLLIQACGSDLVLLRGEIEKLAVYAGEGSNVTLQMAEELTAHQQNSTGLKLVDALMEGDLAKSLHIYQDLIKAKEEPIALIALLASQIRTILHVKLLKQKGYNSAKMAEVSKVHPFVIKLALKREAHFTQQELEAILMHAAETDAALKQGRMEKSLAFEMLLYTIAAMRNKTRLA